MKLIKYLSTAIVVAIAFYSCKQENYLLYDSESFLRFGGIPTVEKEENPNDVHFADTLNNYTFYYEPSDIAEKTVYFYLYTIGDVKDYDREVTIEQVEMEGVSNAIPKTHYKPFDEYNYVIPANKTYVKLPVTLYRHADLKSSSVILRLQVVENDQFRIGEKHLSWREVTFTDDLQRPNAWNQSVVSYYFGEYSKTKHEWMIEMTGEKWDQEFMVELNNSYDLLRYYILLFNSLLIEKNKELAEQEGEGVVFEDENGNPIEFPS